MVGERRKRAKSKAPVKKTSPVKVGDEPITGISVEEAIDKYCLALGFDPSDDKKRDYARNTIHNYMEDHTLRIATNGSYVPYIDIGSFETCLRIDKGLTNIKNIRKGKETRSLSFTKASKVSGYPLGVIEEFVKEGKVDVTGKGKKEVVTRSLYKYIKNERPVIHEV